MFELCVYGGYCCACVDKSCLSNSGRAYHKRYHGSKIYKFRKSWWDIWRPSLERAAEQSLRSAQRIREELQNTNNYISRVRQKVELIQKEPLVDAMMKALD